MAYPWSDRNPLLPDWVPDTVTRYVSVPLPGDCYMQCPYCISGASTRQSLPRERVATDEQVAATWREIAETEGPYYLAIDGLEPTTCLPLLSAVTQHHYACIQTNLQCRTRAFVAAIDPDRVEIHPSFHPHGWRYGIERFTARCEALRMAGYRVPMVAIVGYPPYLRDLQRWADTLQQYDYVPNIQPFRGEYNGCTYPDAYTDDERALLDPWCARPTTTAPVPHRISCGAGVCFAGVSYGGDISYCALGAVVAHTGTLGNLYAGDRIPWREEPMQCPLGVCGCPQLRVTHIAS